MAKQRLQFSLKQLFLFTACTAGVFALVGWLWRVVGARSTLGSGIVFALWFLVPLVGLWGATIGTFRSQTWIGAFWGAICGLFLAFLCVVAICLL
jgi:hypothetical protein